MSLILEALKKAERQHRMGEVPGIGSTHHDEPRQRSKLLTVTLIGGLALGMLSLGMYLGEEGPIEPADRQAEMSIELPSSVSMQPAEQQAPVAPPARQSEPAILKSAPAPMPKPEPKPERTEPAVEPPVSSVAKSPDQPKARELPVEAKLISQLPDGFVDQLPSLNIDIHSYDKQPGRSYVLINMEKYREGDRLTEGPLLDEILQDGVVLEHMGERFILPIGNY